MENSKMSLKLLIDSRRNKVVFAEAGKEFVDFLLSLLSLPVGTVIRLLTKSNMAGCIANLYESLENLNESFLQPNQSKDSLLKPTIPTQVTNPNFLLPDAGVKAGRQKLYYCARHPGYVTDIPNSLCINCRTSQTGFSSNMNRSPLFGIPVDCAVSYMNQEVQFVTSNSTNSAAKPRDEGGYVKGVVTYMVTDDLCVSPMSMVSGVCLLNRLNIENFGALEEKVVHEIGINEGLELLKASLMSKNALTDAFLQKQNVRAETMSHHPSEINFQN